MGSSQPSRVVSAEMVFGVVERAELSLQVVASTSATEAVGEELAIAVDGEPIEVTTLAGPHGASMQVFDAAPGHLTVHYRAELEVHDPDPDPQPAYERQLYLRPSRYSPSDHLVGFAVAEFGAGGDTGSRVSAITEWIRRRIGYVPGSSDVHDSAEDTLLTGMGTCRDFAHLGVALCRATGIPARFVSVYAPGLSPMDFHAVFETYEAGRWCVHDPTGLAPRQSLVRIVTGRDAADTAFAAVTSGVANLEHLEVTATTSGDLPLDDHVQLAVLG